MPFQYSNEQKLEALRLLFETMGDVRYVSSETGISVRTLQHWKSRYRARVTAKPDDLPNMNDRYFKEQYRFIREKLFKQVTGVIKHMEYYSNPEVLADLTPTLARLIDRLTKMENLIREGHFTFTIQWANPDELETEPSDSVEIQQKSDAPEIEESD